MHIKVKWEKIRGPWEFYLGSRKSSSSGCGACGHYKPMGSDHDDDDNDDDK